jgi:hypothetical protein
MAILAISVVLPGCSVEEVKVTDAAGVHSLVDQQGHIWDITTAVNRYGMQPDGWEFGLGKGVIEPLIEPAMVGPGEGSYPPDTESFATIGVVVGEDARGYHKSRLSRNEVVDATIGGAKLAVTY